MGRYAPLESSWAKFHRAGTHLDCLDAKLKRLLGDPSHAVGIEHKFERGVAFVQVSRVPELHEAGLLIGDAVTNYRAALDHLAWDLVKMGSEPRPKRPQDIQFPLANSFDTLRDQRRRRLPGVSDEQWNIVRLYQPYRRGDTGIAVRRLRNWSDFDKHRYIAPAVMSATEFRWTVTLTNCWVNSIKQRSPKRALHVGAKLMELGLVVSPGFAIDIEGQITVQPSLDRGVGVMPAMLAVRQTVFDVLRRFEALL